MYIYKLCEMLHASSNHNRKPLAILNRAARSLQIPGSHKMRCIAHIHAETVITTVVCGIG